MFDKKTIEILKYINALVCSNHLSHNLGQKLVSKVIPVHPNSVRFPLNLVK